MCFQLLKLFNFLIYIFIILIIFTQRETEICKTNHPLSNCTTIAEAFSL